MKALTKLILTVCFFIPLFVSAQNEKDALSPIKFEHLRINVANKEATAKWYVENLGLEIIPSNNKEVVYNAPQNLDSVLR